MKYRRKENNVEAIQYNGEKLEELKERIGWLDGKDIISQDGIIMIKNYGKYTVVNKGDFIAYNQTAGEIYPIEKEKFEKNYQEEGITKTHIERMEEEKAELEAKKAAAEAFIVKEKKKAEFLDVTQLGALEKQSTIMRDYIAILEERIEYDKNKK